MNVVLNGHVLSSFHINVGISQGSILSPAAYLIFMNYLLDVINSQLYIYVDDTIIYSCRSSKSVRTDKIELAAALQK